MTEIWLHSNRRILLMAMVPVLVVAGLGMLGVKNDWSAVLRLLGSVLVGGALLLLVGLVRQIFRSRISYRDGKVMFYLRAGGPIAVPVQFVEAFFQGQGPAHLPGESQQETKSVNLIARLSQRESDWQERDVKAALGSWAEGYVTIRGTWCEPITDEVIRRLNRRLREVTREQEAAAEDTSNR